MGATGYHIEPSTTTKEAILAYLTNDCGYDVVDLAVKGSVGYAAVRHDTIDDGRVFAMVALTSRHRNDYFNFSIKLVDEDMGPAEDQCPARILDLLGPPKSCDDPDNEYGRQWRERCRRSLVRRAEAKRVVPGVVIRLAEPVEFSDGATRDTFRFEKGSVFVADDGVRVRVTRWRDRSFEVVSAA